MLVPAPPHHQTELSTLQPRRGGSGNGWWVGAGVLEPSAAMDAEGKATAGLSTHRRPRRRRAQAQAESALTSPPATWARLGRSASRVVTREPDLTGLDSTRPLIMPGSEGRTGYFWPPPSLSPTPQPLAPLLSWSSSYRGREASSANGGRWLPLAPLAGLTNLACALLATPSGRRRWRSRPGE